MDKIVLIDCDSLLYKNMEDLDEYMDRIDKIISSIVFKSKATHYKCFLESVGNYTFRKILNPNYKANRIGKPLPFNFREIKQYIIETYDPYLSKGIETDDSIISTWCHIKNKFPLTEVLVAANDKDYLTYPIRYFDLYHRRFGEVSDVSNKDAIYNFATQMLAGDASDNVKGLKGVGKKGAEKILSNVQDLNKVNLIKTLIGLYKAKYKSKYKELLRLNFNMLWLRSDCKPCKEFNRVEFETQNYQPKIK